MSPITEFGDVRADGRFHFAHVELSGGTRIGSTCWPLTLAERRDQERGLGLIVGEAPAAHSYHASRPGEPLTHDSRVGKRLLDFTDLSEIEYYRLFDRMNLLPRQDRAKSAWFGPNGYEFDLIQAERNAGEAIDDVIIPRAYKLIILLGARVHRAFATQLNDSVFKAASWYQPVHSSVISSEWVAMPHPSGTSRTWNSREAVDRARVELKLLVAKMRAGP